MADYSDFKENKVPEAEVALFQGIQPWKFEPPGRRNEEVNERANE